MCLIIIKVLTMIKLLRNFIEIFVDVKNFRLCSIESLIKHWYYFVDCYKLLTWMFFPRKDVYLYYQDEGFWRA